MIYFSGAVFASLRKAARCTDLKQAGMPQGMLWPLKIQKMGAKWCNLWPIEHYKFGACLANFWEGNLRIQGPSHLYP